MNMNKDSLRVREEKTNILHLNKMFHEFKVAPEEFFQQLKSRDVDIGLSILISICPDGDNTYFGSLINQFGNICSFDIDCDDEKYSRWDISSSNKLHKSPQHTKSKPWDAEVIALDLFKER